VTAASLASRETAQRLGELDAWGIEGTGSFGAGLTRFLRSRGQVVVEVNRPDRAARRRRGKPTRWMPRLPLGLSRPSTAAPPRPAMGRWR
jgi:hypothetical protein